MYSPESLSYRPTWIHWSTFDPIHPPLPTEHRLSTPYSTTLPGNHKKCLTLSRSVPKVSCSVNYDSCVIIKHYYSILASPFLRFKSTECEIVVKQITYSSRLYFILKSELFFLSLSSTMMTSHGLSHFHPPRLQGSSVLSSSELVLRDFHLQWPGLAPACLSCPSSILLFF